MTPINRVFFVIVSSVYAPSIRRATLVARGVSQYWFGLLHFPPTCRSSSSQRRSESVVGVEARIKPMISWYFYDAVLRSTKVRPTVFVDGETRKKRRTKKREITRAPISRCYANLNVKISARIAFKVPNPSDIIMCQTCATQKHGTKLRPRGTKCIGGTRKDMILMKLLLIICPDEATWFRRSLRWFFGIERYGESRSWRFYVTQKRVKNPSEDVIANLYQVFSYYFEYVIYKIGKLCWSNM